MMNIFFQLQMTKTYISVSNSNKTNPVSIHSDETATQQMIRQPYIVTFATLNNSDDCIVHIRMVDQAEVISHQATKITFVSFKVGELGIMVSSNGNPIHVDIPAGNYRLTFHAIPALRADDLDTYEFVFVKN